MFAKIINHMRTDPNAEEHARLGLLGCIILIGPIMWLIGLIVGVGIEVVQKLRGGKNSWREAALDALGTSLFFYYYYKRMYR